MRITLILVALLMLAVAAKAEQQMLLAKATWAVPKSAETVLAMPVLQEAMQQMQASSTTRLKVFYPGGDEGSLWAIEVRGWLVSLGLEADRIKLISGSQYPDRLHLQVED